MGSGGAGRAGEESSARRTPVRTAPTAVQAGSASFRLLLLRYAVNRRSILRNEIFSGDALYLIERDRVDGVEHLVDLGGVIVEEGERGEKVCLSHRRFELVVEVRSEAHFRVRQLFLRHSL